jgi:hypothetical protein
MNASYLDKLPSPILLFDLDTPLFIQTDSSGVDDSGSQYRSLGRWESFTLVVCCCPLACRDLSCGIDEFLERNVSVTL